MNWRGHQKVIELVISHERTRISDFGYNAGIKLHSNINVFLKNVLQKVG